MRKKVGKQGQAYTTHQQVYDPGKYTEAKIVKRITPGIAMRVVDIAENELNTNNDHVQRGRDQHE